MRALHPSQNTPEKQYPIKCKSKKLGTEKERIQAF